MSLHVTSHCFAHVVDVYSIISSLTVMLIYSCWLWF